MSEKGGIPKGTPLPRTPRYFQLLDDEDLDQLRPLLEAVRDRCSEVVANWYEMYVVHFGDSRSLSQAEFTSVFEPIVLRAESALLRKDMEAYIGDMLRLGEDLTERRVTLQELIAALHLFEEAAGAVFPQDPRPTLETYELFDKLNHVRLILLVDAYVRSQKALAGTRIRALELEAANLAPSQRTRFRGLVGKSPAMRRIYEQIEAAASALRPVIVLGEDGTEKEIVARAIHESGTYALAPFVAFDCVTLPEDLIDGELFGYRHGGSNGHQRQYLGLFRAAEGGTLYLADVDKMPASTQARLLRALRDGLITSVGSVEPVPVKVRVIASMAEEPQRTPTSARLDPALWAELSTGTVIEVPALRERPEDLPLLAEHFLDLFNEKFERPEPPYALAEDALRAMANYAWPGNMHEIREVLQAAFMAAPGPTIRLVDLPPPIGGEAADSGYRVPSFAEAEHELIRRALDIAAGNKSSAARMLKISRKKLYSKLARYERVRAADSEAAGSRERA
jgi:DNA-binding NtrC family response regulator